MEPRSHDEVPPLCENSQSENEHCEEDKHCYNHGTSPGEMECIIATTGDAAGIRKVCTKIIASSTPTCVENENTAITGSTCSCNGNDCIVNKYCYDNGCHDSAKVITPTTTSCVASETAAITTSCKCASSSSTNECIATKFCYDNTCHNSAKAIAPTTTSCVASETAAITTSCKCASSSSTNECQINQWCYDNSCHSKTKNGPDACTPSGSVVISAGTCQCGANVCNTWKYCWALNECHGSPKPTDCLVSDDAPVTGRPCRCDQTQSSAECNLKKFCYDGTCHDIIKPYVPPTNCMISGTTAITTECRCDVMETSNECVVSKYCWGGTCQNDVQPPPECLENNYNEITTGTGCNCGSAGFCDVSKYCWVGFLCQDDAKPLPTSCATTGDAGGMYDCSSDINDLDAAPDSIECMDQTLGCTADECCTSVPMAPSPISNEDSNTSPSPNNINGNGNDASNTGNGNGDIATNGNDTPSMRKDNANDFNNQNTDQQDGNGLSLIPMIVGLLVVGCCCCLLIMYLLWKRNSRTNENKPMKLESQIEMVTNPLGERGGRGGRIPPSQAHPTIERAAPTPTPQTQPQRHTRTRTKLPNGWGKDTDESGHAYYYNASTNSTSWEAPPGSVQIPIGVGAETASRAAVATPATTTTTTTQHCRTKTKLPPGWSKDVDTEGHAYYYRTSDGTCAWDKPPGSIQIPIQEHAPPTTMAPTSPWKKDTDSDGHVYYYNENDGTTSWEIPEGYVDQFPAAAAANTATAASTTHGRSETVMPPGWGKDHDAEGNKYYYKGNDIQWEKPPGNKVSL